MRYRCGHCAKDYDKFWILCKHMYEKHGIEEPAKPKKSFFDWLMGR